MRTNIFRHRALPLLAFAALASSTSLHGWTDVGHRWVGTTSIAYYVNPQSIYVSPNAAISAVQQAASGWNQQTNANIELVYAGTTNGTALTLNSKNEVFFRNGSNGGNVAETYYWWDGSGKLVDADIVFYEGAYHFYVGSGCSAGIYVENVAIHEFGHVLGLSHTAVPGATMAPSMSSYCDTTQLTLEADDIAGLESLYPPVSGTPAPSAPASLSVAQNSAAPSTSLELTWADTSNVETGFRIERSTGGGFTQVGQVGANATSWVNTGLTAGTSYGYRVVAFNGTGASAYSNTATGQTAAAAAPVNTAPAVAVSNPSNNASYPEGSTITFSGSASDNQDGNLSPGLRWTSSLMGPIGNGSSFSRTLTAGTHVISASVTDSGGMAGSQQVTMTVTVEAQAPVAPSNASLSATGSVVRNKAKVELRWSGLNGSRADVYRNGSRVTTQNNDGSWTDSFNSRGGSFTYKVCTAGTSSCSNEARVSF